MACSRHLAAGLDVGPAVSLPHLDAGQPDGTRLLRALQAHGAVRLDLPEVPATLVAALLDGAQRFFSGPQDDKRRIAEPGRPPFRGYSRQHGERDHREQLHIGPERPARQGGEAFHALQGPNRWPADAAFTSALQDYHRRVAAAGHRVLAALAEPLGADARAWLGDDPYDLLKVIAYPPSSGPPRPGVAAHLDWSLVTLTLQDDVGGLEVQRPDGTWTFVEPQPGSWLLHVGELLAYVSGGRLRATPHRVVNRTHTRTRLSLPLFVNPSLDGVLQAGADEGPPPVGTEHVHAVLAPGPLPRRLGYGASEWQRKAGRRWCHACCTPAAEP